MKYHLHAEEEEEEEVREERNGFVALTRETSICMFFVRMHAVSMVVGFAAAARHRCCWSLSCVSAFCTESMFPTGIN